MNKFLFLLLIISGACLIPGAAMRAEASTAGAVTAAVDDAKSSFIHSISDYYSAPVKEVTAVLDKGIPSDELPVVYFLSRQAKVEPAVITEQRLNGDSWQAITDRYKHSPEIFYVPLSTGTVAVPPYGHAYGYYKNKPRKDWKKIKLDDADIVNMVNLKFMTKHYGYPAASVMKMRSDDTPFNAIGNDIENQRKANKARAKAAKDKKAKAGQGHVTNKKAAKKPKASVNRKKSAKKPAHLTGTKKQVSKVKKFFKKKNKKAKKYINDKG